MQKKMQTDEEACQVSSSEYKCPKCKDSEFVFRKEPQIRYDSEGQEKVYYVEVGEPCDCRDQRMLERRLQNALIPEEFASARFDSYIQETTAQQLLYKTMADYLRTFPEIERTRHNSLGFMAEFGELRIRQLPPKERAEAKLKYNNFGLGKTHLQVAAAKYLMKHGEGKRVLMIADATFMDDLIAAKMAKDDGEELNRLLGYAISVDVLIWDDIGKSKHSEAKENLYYQIIDGRYRKKKPILFSSNEDDETIAEKIGYAAWSRLQGMAKNFLVAVSGEDYRTKG